MRDIGKMFTGKMFPAVSLGTIALKDQREPRHLRFSPYGYCLPPNDYTGPHRPLCQPRQGNSLPIERPARFRTKTSRLTKARSRVTDRTTMRRVNQSSSGEKTLL